MWLFGIVCNVFLSGFFDVPFTVYGGWGHGDTNLVMVVLSVANPTCPYPDSSLGYRPHSLRQHFNADCPLVRVAPPEVPPRHQCYQKKCRFFLMGDSFVIVLLRLFFF